MNMIKKAVFIGMTILSINTAAADDCREVPSCASLGFDMSTKECGKEHILRCPFDRVNNEAVWCHKKNADFRCGIGDYFDAQTGRCYPNNVSDYIFMDDEADLKAAVLQISATTIIKGTTYDEFVKIGREENIIPLRYFYKIEEYLFKKFGVGCYIVANDSENEGSIVYFGSNRIGIRLDPFSFQKYCFSDNINAEPRARAIVLKYKLFDYRWK